MQEDNGSNQYEIGEWETENMFNNTEDAFVIVNEVPFANGTSFNHFLYLSVSSAVLFLAYSV